MTSMQILVAEDDPVSRRLLETLLAQWGYEVVVVSDGAEAWRQLQGASAPALAILDWMMPGMDGPDVCRRIRGAASAEPIYVILLTARESKRDVVAGLEAGADDYVTKPFDRDELRARVRVGVRVVELQRKLASRVRELGDALQRVKQLQGLLPICSYCKRVRNDRDYWEQIDAYITEHSEAQFSHGICPECFEKIAKPMMKGLASRKKTG